MQMCFEYTHSLCTEDKSRAKQWDAGDCQDMEEPSCPGGSYKAKIRFGSMGLTTLNYGKWSGVGTPKTEVPHPVR